MIRRCSSLFRPSRPSPPIRSILALIWLMSAPLLSACAYELRGRVTEDAFDSVMVVAADDARLEGGRPVTGARIVLTRDPGSLNRRDVASAVSDGGGWFTLRVEEMGAGWMEEQWSVRIARTGFTGAEDLLRLPFDPKKSRLLVTLAPGPARRSAEQGAGARIDEDIRRFGSSPTGGVR